MSSVSCRIFQQSTKRKKKSLQDQHWYYRSVIHPAATPPKMCPKMTWIHPLCPTKQKQRTMCSRFVGGLSVTMLWVLTGRFLITGSNIESLTLLLSDSDCWTQKSDLAQRGSLLYWDPFFFTNAPNYQWVKRLILTIHMFLNWSNTITN